MSKASRIIQRVESGKRRKRKIARAAFDEFAQDESSGCFSVRADTLWWLLSCHMIEKYEYYAVRQFQGAYLEAQIQPPKCLLGRGAGFTLSWGGLGEYPNEGNFNALKYLGRIRHRIGAGTYKILDLTFCHYWAGDDKLSDDYKQWLRANLPAINSAVHILAHATGYTTETLYAREKRQRRELERSEQVLRGEPTGLHTGGNRSENDGGNEALLRPSSNVRLRDRAAA